MQYKGGKGNWKHGKTYDPLYKKWIKMKYRCYGKNSKDYKYYGGRGIGICPQWKYNYLSFYNWAIKNGWDSKLELDRRNNNKGYSPRNCRFIDRKQNMRNTRRNKMITYKGETKSLVEWVEILNVSYGGLKQRLNKLKWSVEKSFTKPYKKRTIMKKITVLSGLFLISTLFLKAQNFTVSVQGGYSINKAATAGLTFGMNFKNFNTRTGFDQHLSSSISVGTVFKTYIGHTFNLGDYYINPGIGHSFVLKSMDRKELNYNAVLYTSEFGYKWAFKEQAMGTYLSFSHAGDLNMVSIGIRGLWGNNYSN